MSVDDLISESKIWLSQ